MISLFGLFQVSTWFHFTFGFCHTPHLTWHSFLWLFSKGVSSAKGLFKESRKSEVFVKQTKLFLYLPTAATASAKQSKPHQQNHKQSFFRFFLLSPQIPARFCQTKGRISALAKPHGTVKGPKWINFSAESIQALSQRPARIFSHFHKINKLKNSAFWLAWSCIAASIHLKSANILGLYR